MNKKHVLIAGLMLCIAAVVTVVSESSQGLRYPVCDPPMGSQSTPETFFLLFVDRTLEASLLSRMTYLMKAIACEIPISNKSLITVVSQAGEQTAFGKLVSSDEVKNFLNVEHANLGKDVSECFSFRKALGRAPSAVLDKTNVHFVVPMFGTDPGCSILDEFRQFFKNDPRSSNYFFHGILIDTEPTVKNNQSVRVVIPDFKKAIDTNRMSLVGSANITDVHNSAPLVQSYASMVRDIIMGNHVHDWDVIETTSRPTTSTLPTSSKPSTTVKVDKEDLMEMFKFNGDDDDDVKVVGALENSTTTATTYSSTFSTFESSSTSTSHSPTTSAFINSTSPRTSSERSEKRAAQNSTSSATTSTSISSTTSENNTTNVGYDSDDDADEMLEMMSGYQSKGDNSTEQILFATPPGKWEWFEADTLIYLLCLFLLIWLFCLFLCLVWMFYCAKKKKNRLENEAEQQQSAPLIENGGIQKPKAAKKESTASDEEDEWKIIKPSARTETAPKSETESVKQPPVAARYEPVEVSEFEDGKNDDDLNEAPRHGYVPAKKAGQLQFD